MKELIDLVSTFFNLELYSGKSVQITLGTIAFVILSFILTFIALKLLKKAILKVFSLQENVRLQSLFSFMNCLVYVIVFFFILNGIGVNINMFLTTSAALFVGLGFALQKIFQDLIAGIYIILDNTLRVGDIIEIDGKVAKVRVINLRSTIAETRDCRILVIPNRIMIDEVFHNWTQDSEVIRAKVEVGVYIGEDVQKVKNVLLQSVVGHPDVLTDPKAWVMLHEFGESSIRFYLNYFICDSFENDKIASEIRFRIDELFKENNIKLPVPVLRLKQERWDE